MKVETGLQRTNASFASSLAGRLATLTYCVKILPLIPSAETFITRKKSPLSSIQNPGHVKLIVANIIEAS